MAVERQFTQILSVCMLFSRTAVEAANSSSGRFTKKNKLTNKMVGGDQPFSGNILLKFRHYPKLMDGKNDPWVSGGVSFIR